MAESHYGETCEGCGGPLRGQIVKYGSEKYHPGCVPRESSQEE